MNAPGSTARALAVVSLALLPAQLGAQPAAQDPS